MLHADVVTGPKGPKPPIDASEFIYTYNSTKNLGLSLGWTTYRVAEIKEGYSEVEIQAMQHIVTAYVQSGSSEQLNFPLRAAYAVKSQQPLKNFFDNVKRDHPKVTYSIYTEQNDEIKPDELTAFVKLIGLDNVYLVINDELRKQLDLSGGNGSGKDKGGAAGLVQFGLLNLAMLIVVAILGRLH